MFLIKWFDEIRCENNPIKPVLVFPPLPLASNKMEDIQARVQKAVHESVARIDKECLRKMQVNRILSVRHSWMPVEMQTPKKHFMTFE